MKKYVTKREALKRQKNPHPTNFHYIMAQIGSEHLYSFLEPKDLLSFSLTNHRTFEDISENLMWIAAQQMPIEMSFNRIGDIGSPERDDFTTTISISSQLTHNCPARLFEHLAKKLAKNNILIRGASSQGESNSKVVDILNEKGRVDLQLPTDSSDKARETYERFQQLSPLRMCAYFKQGLEKPRRWLFGEDSSPREKAKEILDGRMRLTWFRDQEEYKLVRHWLHFILSKKDVSKTVFLWGWSLLQLGIVTEKDPEYWQDAIIMEDRLGRTIEVTVTKSTTTKGSFVVGSGPQGGGSVAAYPIQQPSARN